MVLSVDWHEKLLLYEVLQNVLSLGSDYFSATFYQTYVYYKLSKSISPLPLL